MGMAGDIPIEPVANQRDTPSLGHCDYQFYGSAAGHYFSPVALFVGIVERQRSKRGR
jgi:hypothetical protein